MASLRKTRFSFSASRSTSRKLGSAIEINDQHEDATSKPMAEANVEQDVTEQHNDATDGLEESSGAEADANNAVVAEKTNLNERRMEGFLLLRVHVRRRRYCILEGRTLHVFKSKPADDAGPRSAKKQIIVVGVKDALALEKRVRTSLLGGGSFNNALVVSSHKSKLVVVEAETRTEKMRWLHAMTTINLAFDMSEKSFFSAMMAGDDFNAHEAVTLLHKHRTSAEATELVLDRLTAYAEQNVDDVEFYVPQIVHLIVNTELAATDKLVHLLLSICRAKAYVEHLGNCIHLALQLFWLLEARIEDKDPKTYNLCAKLLMSIEAKVVNQQFELPSTQTAGDVARRLKDIPHMKERLEQMAAENEDELTLKEALPRSPAAPSSPIGCEDASRRSPPKPPTSEATTCINAADPEQQSALMLQWMLKERQKRYKYFHEQRDFVRALTDISEQMHAVDPPHERKQHLPAALEALGIPEMAYIPLGRVSDPFCRITRVLTNEGTVFSTHSRAPCLLCFEVIEDQVNSAGHRSVRTTKSKPHPSSRLLLGGLDAIGSLGSSGLVLANEEAEVARLIQKFAINGQLICVENPSIMGDEDDEDGDTVSSNNDESVDSGRTSCSPRAEDVHDLDGALNSPSAAAMSTTTDDNDDQDYTAEEISRKAGNETSRRMSLIRRSSRAAYEMGLSKLLGESAVFGESWQDKKERIRASSPFGHLPGWNVISLISKSNDDIRQEVFAMQLISMFRDIFQENELPLWLRPYRIVSTGRTTGLLETITDAQSLDALKKHSAYVGLRAHFESTYGDGDDSSKAFKTAQRNFLHSLAAYSVVCYLLQIKDRHNGNILLDTAGHLVHIDFGFMLGIAPGGNWSFETAPFKLTKEMVAVLGGVSSALFGEFVQLVALGLLAAQRHTEKIVTLVEIMMDNSTFPCFQGRDVSRDLQKLRDRFLLHCSTEQTVKAVIKMIRTSYKNKWTKRYDQFQKITNGIVP